MRRSFSIDRGTAQLSTKADVPLDTETKDTYTVTVTATDPSGLQTATITVTIKVNWGGRSAGDHARRLGDIGHEPSVEYAEDDTMPVATYTASGPNGDMAMWSLSGDDAGFFDIPGGVLSFNSPHNYEDPMDADMDNVYEITVHANDGTYMAMRNVTVTVTNEDELGMLLVGQDSVGYMENDTVAVGTYTADGPLTPTWSVEGDDMEAFTIGGSSGELMFASPPDFEAPVDMGMDNMYQVTVKAEAGGEMDMMDVTVTVTNVEEPGEVTLSAMQPVVGKAVTATLMDPDGGEMDVTWKWARSMDMSDWTDIMDANDAMYMPMAMDYGYYLRATAMYTDGEGSDKSAMGDSDNMVIMMTVPMFDSETVTMEVADNTAAGMNIGTPVTATDADADALTYTLGGTDAASFDIDAVLRPVDDQGSLGLRD